MKREMLFTGQRTFWLNFLGGMVLFYGMIGLYVYWQFPRLRAINSEPVIATVIGQKEYSRGRGEELERIGYTVDADGWVALTGDQPVRSYTEITYTPHGSRRARRIPVRYFYPVVEYVIDGEQYRTSLDTERIIRPDVWTETDTVEVYPLDGRPEKVVLKGTDLDRHGVEGDEMKVVPAALAAPLIILLLIVLQWLATGRVPKRLG